MLATNTPRANKESYFLLNPILNSTQVLMWLLEAGAVFTLCTRDLRGRSARWHVITSLETTLITKLYKIPLSSKNR